MCLQYFYMYGCIYRKVFFHRCVSEKFDFMIKVIDGSWID